MSFPIGALQEVMPSITMKSKGTEEVSPGSTAQSEATNTQAQMPTSKSFTRAGERDVICDQAHNFLETRWQEVSSMALDVAWFVNRRIA